MFFQSPLEHLFKKSGLSLNEFSSKLSISKSSLSKIFDKSTENKSKLSERETEKIKIVENQVRETIKQFSSFSERWSFSNASQRTSRKRPDKCD